MKFAVISLLAASLASTNVGAAPTPSEAPGTSPNLVARDTWMRDQCLADYGGTIAGGSTLWMLRNTWNNKFGGDFSGRLGVYETKGVCCWGQCLWVTSEGQGRSWSGDAWGNALSRLTNLVGGQQVGVCGARVNNDAYLVLKSAQHDKVSLSGRTMGQIFGDTCNGRPPW